METIKTRIATGETVENEEGKTVKVYEEVIVSYDMGDNLKSFTKLFGNDVAFSHAKAQGRVGVQARVRALYNAGKSTEEIQTELESYKLGDKVVRVAVDPQQAILKDFGNWDAEKQAEFLAKLGVEA